MIRRNRPSQRPQHRLLCVEALEDRWLLSGLLLPAHSAPATQETVLRGAVQVVELRAATELGDSDVPIAPSEVPTNIVATLHARFPGAELLAAELSTEGGTPVYEVSAEVNGQPIDVRLTRNGDLMETERALTSGELPQSVLDWVRQHFPGAVIREATLVTEAGGVSYEVLIAGPEGREIEATFRFQDAQTPRASIGPDQPVGDRPDFVRMTTTAAAETPAPQVPLAPESPGKSEADGTAKQASGAPAPLREQTAPPPTDWQRAITQTDRHTLEQTSPGGGEPQVESVANVSRTTWLPQVAGVISELLPIDVARVEQALRQLLGEIDALAEKAGGERGVKSVAWQVVIVAALITSARLVLLESRRSRREPVLAAAAANSSWSWVLGAATPQRS